MMMASESSTKGTPHEQDFIGAGAADGEHT
jgi:hypothetical protein